MSLETFSWKATESPAPSSLPLFASQQYSVFHHQLALHWDLQSYALNKPSPVNYIKPFLWQWTDDEHTHQNPGMTSSPTPNGGKDELPLKSRRESPWANQISWSPGSYSTVEQRVWRRSLSCRIKRVHCLGSIYMKLEIMSNYVWTLVP